MATENFFALLGDDENDDPSDLLARAGASAASSKASPAEKSSGALAAKKQQQQPPQRGPPAAKLPSRPLPPAQAVRETQSDGGRGRGNRGARGGGRGTYGNREFGNRDRSFEGGFNRSSREGGFQGDREENNDRIFNIQRNGGDFQGGRSYFNSGSALSGDGNSPGEDAEGGRESSGSRGRGRARGRGGGRGFGFPADSEERPRRREYDRRSGTGRGNELKRDGSGRGNWGIDTEVDAVQEGSELNVTEEEKITVPETVEKKPEDEQQPEVLDAAEKKDEEEEDNEMTLDEYEKIKSEKRRALESAKAKERKVAFDKDFESMQIVDKRNDEEVFLKLGSDKDKGKRKEILEKEERAKKCVSINEFLKPAEGEEYYSPTSRRGRGGRGRGERGGIRGGFGGGGYVNSRQDVLAPRIEDPGQFPTLSGV